MNYAKDTVSRNDLDIGFPSKQQDMGLEWRRDDPRARESS